MSAGHAPADLHTLVLQRLPGFLAAIGMLLLLVMSIVALWPPSNAAHITPRVQSTLDETPFARKVFDRSELFPPGMM